VKKTTLLYAFCLYCLTATPQVWNDLGGGVSAVVAKVKALQGYGQDLYVGGNFLQAGSIEAWGVASWNGNQWDSLTSGLDAAPDCFEVYNNELYVGGIFLSAGAVPNTKKIASWDGSNWASVANDVQTTTAVVYAMAEYNGDLYSRGCGRKYRYCNDIYHLVSSTDYQ